MVGDAPAGTLVRTRRVLFVGDAPLFATLAAEPSLTGVDVARATGRLEALEQLQRRDIDAVVTDPSTSVQEDLAFAGEIRARRRSARDRAARPR